MTMKKSITSLSVMLALSACNGDSSSTSPLSESQAPVVETPTTETYSVTAIDGYLRNAQVWLDINGDYQLDKDNEPFAVSGEGGVAELDVTDITNPEQYSVVVKAIAGETVDEDTITDTNPDGAPITSPYVMSAPAGHKDVSPLSTLVKIKMDNGATQNEAVTKVATDLGIDETELLGDYIKDAKGDIASKAKAIVELKVLPESEEKMVEASEDDTDLDDSLENDLPVIKTLKEKQRLIKTGDGAATPIDITNEDDVNYDADADGADKDGDGFINRLDAFPDDATEWSDFDGDGTGDNADTDDDNDNVLDTADAFPYNPLETTDSDGDGTGDNSDAFPNDATKVVYGDRDGDGVRDNKDAFPDDATETKDTDGDGVGDNGDAFPNDANKTTGDSSSGGTNTDIVYTIVNATASAEQTGNEAEKAIDGNSSTDSRWSANSEDGDTFLDLDLGETKTINTLQVEFVKPLERNFCFNIHTSVDGTNWTLQRENITSYGHIFYSFAETDARYIRYEGLGNSGSGWNSLAEVGVLKKVLSGTEDTSSGVAGACDSDLSSNASTHSQESLELELMKSPLMTGTGATFNAGGSLDVNKAPGENFDLSLWKITYPDASEVQPPAVAANEFYTDSTTGAMVFQCPNDGATTSSSTKYSRTELREMLNPSAGTQDLGNNWVISTASDADKAAAGGVDGNMKATVSVDQVSTTTDVGSEYMVGRVIVGQIHASTDEPFKIYYRLLPGHTKGFVYFAYEDSESETFYPMFGDTGFNMYGSDVSAEEPADGIALGEKWSYEVDVVGRDMTVKVIKEDGTWVSRTITWSSEYDSDWFYFKAGTYNQNNGGETGQFARTSFYALDINHAVDNSVTLPKAGEIANADFSAGDLTGWNSNGASVETNAENVYAGNTSLKLTGGSSSATQTLTVAKNTDYTISSYVKGNGKLSVVADGVTFTAENDSSDFQMLTLTFNSGDATTAVLEASAVSSGAGGVTILNPNFDGGDNDWSVFEDEGDTKVIGQVQTSSDSSDAFTDNSKSIKFKYNDDDLGTPYDPYIAQTVTVEANTDYILSTYVRLDSSADSTVTFGVFQEGTDTNILSVTKVAEKDTDFASLKADDTALRGSDDDGFIQDTLAFNSGAHTSLTIFAQYKSSTGDDIRVDQFALESAASLNTSVYFDNFMSDDLDSTPSQYSKNDGTFEDGSGNGTGGDNSSGNDGSGSDNSSGTGNDGSGSNGSGSDNSGGTVADGGTFALDKSMAEVEGSIASTFVEVKRQATSYGEFTIEDDGSWTYEPDLAHTSVSVLTDDSVTLTDSITVTDTNGVSTTLNFTITGVGMVAGGFDASEGGNATDGYTDAVPAVNCTQTVNSVSDLEDAADDLVAGDTLCLADGTYNDTDFKLSVEAQGTPDAPITIAAQTPGQVIITGGDMYARLGGKHIVLQGFVWRDGTSAEIKFEKEAECFYCRATEMSIIDMDGGNYGSSNWIEYSGQYNRIDHSWFSGKESRGALLILPRWTAADFYPEDRAQIDYNYFGDRPPADGKAYLASGDNEYEGVRLGLSFTHEDPSYSVLENNYFERIQGEAEVISNKSANNIIRNNTIRDSAGSIVNRHGADAIIANNFIFGDDNPISGGIRITDEGHTVINNYVEGPRNLSSNYYGGIVISTGGGDQGSSGYQNVKNILVANNTIVDSVNSLNVSGGDPENDTAPENVYFVNNIIANAVGSIIRSNGEDMPANSTYDGNYVYGPEFSDNDDITEASTTGFSVVDAMLEKASDGLYRPSDSSPDLTAAVVNTGDFDLPSIDMDGQDRADITLSGADEVSDDSVTLAPLTSADVGPKGYRPTPGKVYVAKVDIANHDFDSGDLTGWTDNNGSGATITTGDDVFSRGNSLVLDSNDASVSQTITVVANTNYTLSAFMKGTAKLMVSVDGQDYAAERNSDSYGFTTVSFNSGSATSAVITAMVDDFVANKAAILNADFAEGDNDWTVVEGTGIGQVQTSDNSSDSEDSKGSIKLKWNVGDDTGTPHQPYIAQTISVEANTDYTLSIYNLMKKSGDSTIRFGAFSENSDTNITAATIIAEKDSNYDDLKDVTTEGADDFFKDTLSFNTGSSTSVTVFAQFNSTDGDEIRVDQFELSYEGAPAEGTEAFFDSIRLVSHP